jgi:hypothetical protein
MKLKSLYFGICVLLSTLATSVPVFAAHTVTAFNSFHVRAPLGTPDSPYNCLAESYGAVVNGSCGFIVSVSFDLPVDRSVVHTVKIQNYVAGISYQGATCAVWSFDGNGNGKEGQSGQFNPTGAETLTLKSALFGNSMSVLCDIPGGQGIAAITWTP